jgi:hypothetical protein
MSTTGIVVDSSRRRFLCTAVKFLAVAQLGMASSAKEQMLDEGEFPPLDGATEWLNSHPLTARGVPTAALILSVDPTAVMIREDCRSKR